MSNNLCPVKNFIRPDKPHACTYEKHNEPSPHHHVTKPPRNSNDVCSNVLDMIGNSALVRMRNIESDYDIKCNFYAKCEYLNSGGSVKDRIGLRMIEEAEREGRIKPGDYIIEPTSGNTGIGLALVCAVKGYKCIIVMPEKMSKEKNDVLKALGATIIRTPTSAAFDAPNSHISEAQRTMQRLNEENPGCAHILDQYTNPYNPIAHYDSTAQEIIDQLDGRVDMIVAGAGTGGTICGLARKIKEKCPNCIVIGVDPHGSILANPEDLNSSADDASGFYEVEGIGYDFLPTVLDRHRIDAWYKSNDKESFQMSRRLIRREGMLCGGSSGTATYSAIEAIRKYGLKEGQNAVVILPDSIRNYMTKFLSDDWMIARNFLSVDEKLPNAQWWFMEPIEKLKPYVEAIDANIVADNTMTCEMAVKHMKSHAVDCLLVFDEDNVLKHVITKKNLSNKLVIGALTPSDSVTKGALDTFVVLHTNDKLKRLQSSLDSEGYALVLNENVKTRKATRSDVFAVVNTDTFLSYLTCINGSSKREF